MLRVLFLGDIVGEPGRSAVIARLAELKSKYALDFVVVNGENAAGGRGITGKITIDLLRAGVSVVTTGDHIWDQKEILSFIDTEPRLLRPVNYPEGAPGSGSIVLETARSKIGVINVQARTFMQPILENPFRAVEAAVTKIRQETANNISPELLAVIEDLLRQKAVDPHKEAFSIEDFCRRYGISRTLAYDQINLGYLTARKPPGSDRTFILRPRSTPCCWSKSRPNGRSCRLRAV